jgi:hypothetical protein
MEEFITCPIDGAKYNKQYRCAAELSCKVCDRRHPKGIICPINGLRYIKRDHCAAERSCKVCGRRHLKNVKPIETRGRPKKTKQTH